MFTILCLTFCLVYLSNDKFWGKSITRFEWIIKSNDKIVKSGKKSNRLTARKLQEVRFSFVALEINYIICYSVSLNFVLLNFPSGIPSIGFYCLLILLEHVKSIKHTTKRQPRLFANANWSHFYFIANTT